MKISSRTYAVSLHQALKALPTNQHKKIITNFLNRLQKNNHVKQLDSIVKEFAKYLDETTQTERIKVISARPLNDKVRKGISEIMKKVLQAKKIKLVEEKDPALLGGIKIIYNDEVIDASLQKKLIQLKNHLSQ